MMDAGNALRAELHRYQAEVLALRGVSEYQNVNQQHPLELSDKNKQGMGVGTGMGIADQQRLGYAREELEKMRTRKAESAIEMGDSEVDIDPWMMLPVRTSSQLAKRSQQEQEQVGTLEVQGQTPPQLQSRSLPPRPMNSGDGCFPPTPQGVAVANMKPGKLRISGSGTVGSSTNKTEEQNLRGTIMSASRAPKAGTVLSVGAGKGNEPSLKEMKYGKGQALVAGRKLMNYAVGNSTESDNTLS